MHFPRVSLSFYFSYVDRLFTMCSNTNNLYKLYEKTSSTFHFFWSTFLNKLHPTYDSHDLPTDLGRDHIVSFLHVLCILLCGYQPYTSCPFKIYISFGPLILFYNIYIYIFHDPCSIFSSIYYTIKLFKLCFKMISRKFETLFF